MGEAAERVRRVVADDVAVSVAPRHVGAGGTGVARAALRVAGHVGVRGPHVGESHEGAGAAPPAQVHLNALCAGDVLVSDMHRAGVGRCRRKQRVLRVRRQAEPRGDPARRISRGRRRIAIGRRQWAVRRNGGGGCGRKHDRNGRQGGRSPGGARRCHQHASPVPPQPPPPREATPPMPVRAACARISGLNCRHAKRPCIKTRRAQIKPTQSAPAARSGGRRRRRAPGRVLDGRRGGRAIGGWAGGVDVDRPPGGIALRGRCQDAWADGEQGGDSIWNSAARRGRRPLALLPPGGAGRPVR